MAAECQIIFKLLVQTPITDEVEVSGNISELGMWSPSKGLKLKTDSERYPLWSNELPLIVSRGIICGGGGEDALLRNEVGVQVRDQRSERIVGAVAIESEIPCKVLSCSAEGGMEQLRGQGNHRETVQEQCVLGPE
jgi:hypothetical protein